MAKQQVKKQEKEKSGKLIVVAGKRKRAIAKATIKQGNGVVRINNLLLDVFPEIRKLFISEPIVITQNISPELAKSVDINIKVKGGGIESQAEASRLAIARALVEFSKSKELRDAFVAYDRSLLVADVRRKETRKPGISKARAKRQKSYR